MNKLNRMMKLISANRQFRCGVHYLGAAMLVLVSSSSSASPGPLSLAPLFLQQPVQPNIFFMLDDSGSMDWEVLLTKGALSTMDADDQTTQNRGNMDFSPRSTLLLRLKHCAGYNALAYDPTQTYTPWKGEDYYDVAFTDQDPTNALVNPYTGSGNSGSDCHRRGSVYNYNGRTCNLLTEFNTDGAFYFLWDDANSDGEYQDGECPNAEADQMFVKDLPLHGTEENPNSQTNYANWFSYYRKREYVMKRAMSEVIQESTDRMGMGTINQNNRVIGTGEVGTVVRDVDDLTLPINQAAVTAKSTLLHNLLKVNSGGGTPLRLGLENVGKYFRNEMNSSALFDFTPPDDPDSAAGHSPILSADLGGVCQQNFAIVLSDGFWNGNNPSVGNADGDGDTLYDGQSYADDDSNTLADVAMEYYENDLLGNLANDVGTVSITRGQDDNPQQHLVTFTVAFGITGTIPNEDPAGGPCLPPNRTDSLATQNWPTRCDATLPTGWPTPVENTSTTVDDMLHAAWNGRGLYLNAKDPDDLIRRFQDAIGNISSRETTAAAAVAVNSINLVQGDFIFQGRFDSTNWSGELRAIQIGQDGNGQLAWTTATTLDQRADPRVMISYNGTQGIGFHLPADYQSPGDNEMTAAQVADLMTNAPFAADTVDADEKADNQAYGESLVDFLRGDHSNEGFDPTDFRSRGAHKLGDIIHSAPFFVGDPYAALYPDNIEGGGDNSYQQWANVDAIGRRKMLYVGANDGALHGFNAETGVEVFAYFPQAVYSSENRGGLHWLADQEYEHHYYVDQTPVAAEVFFGNSWRTVLVGGLRGGGRALFALDVSDPTDFDDETTAAGNVLWEFTHDDLGFTYSQPTIARLNGAVVDGVNTGRWAAIFGNGYNPGPASDGKAKLFIVYLDGEDPPYKVIDTGIGSIANGDCLDATSNCNGMSTPAVLDLSGDGIADRVYAGDVLGNLWAFDLTSADSNQWGPAFGTIGTPLPMFSAKDDADNAQPITGKPTAIFHPSKRDLATEPNLMIYFGTGQYITEGDLTSAGTQSFYGLWDNGTQIAVARDTVLVEQTVTEQIVSVDGEDVDVRLLSDHLVNYDFKKGWFIDFPTAKERTIVSPVVFGDYIFYVTLIPSGSACGAVSGQSWLMVHNITNGGEPNSVALDINNDGNFDAQDKVGGENVGGVKSGSIYWQPSLVRMNGKPTMILPTDGGGGGGGGGDDPDPCQGVDADCNSMPPPANIGKRSSWARFRF
ncbi:MAG: hypothetical protein JMN25_13380 [gamma proteobacterium endosymbiont of Lamellibrachia anaximandri]|nr:hypothetical protein [gamma proteobacterium endosymbiont of Lamellibrachia anaximandri]